MPNKLKKAIGVFKDQTSIGLAHVSRRSSPGSSTRLEVVILKATSHDEVPVDDRHLTEVVVLASSSPSTAAAVASALRRRISRTRNWVVALKCLFVLSSTISDSGPDFRPEAAAQRVLDLSLFSDDSSHSSPWDFTAFIRTYALYLDARLQSSLKGHIPPNNRRRSTFSTGMEPSLVLERIEQWQHILDRAIGTRPTGRAKTNILIKISLYTIVTETYDLYHNINRGLSLLLSKFLDLPYPSCVNTFEVCSKAAKQFEELDEFYAYSKKIAIGRAVEYPSIQKISGHLLQTLEKLLKDYQDLDVPMSAMLQSPPKLLLGTESPSSANTCQESVDMMLYEEGWEMALGESTSQSDDAYLLDRQKILKMKSTSQVTPRSSKNLFLGRRSCKGFVASPSTMPLLTSHVYEASKEAAQELEVSKKIASDPFAKSMAWVERMDEPARQQLIKEQQLWLQHQNKITETSLAW